MNENEMLQDDDISLFDLWVKLREGWLVVVGGALLGIVGAVLAIFLIPPKYEAVAVVQVGLVGQIAKDCKEGQGISMPVEPPSLAVERMKTPSFQRKAAEAAGDPHWMSDLSRLSSGVKKVLSVQVLKGTVAPGQTALIEVKATGEAPEIALKRVGAAVDELMKVHEQLARPSLKKMEGDLALLIEKLASAERDLDGLNKLVATTGGKGDRFTQLSLMTSLRLLKDADVFSQRQMIMAIQTALIPPASQPAKAIEAMFVGDRPDSPKKSLLLALGAIVGLPAGVLWVFAADAWRQAKARRVVLVQ
jgi:uncharacterized protein involved in exopolysaccharide biosynthesis